MLNYQPFKKYLFAIGIAALVITAVWWRSKPVLTPVATVPVKIDDSTEILQAQLASSRRELNALKEAAKKTGSKVVAGVTVIIKPETTTVTRTIHDTVYADGTRVAVLHDTTDGGAIVKVEARAPSYPLPVQIGYTLIQPELRPEVGFLERNGSYYAVVSLAGRQFTQKEAFFRVKRPPRVSLNAGAQVVTDQAQLRALGFLGLDAKVTDRLTMRGAITTGNNILVQSTYRLF